MISNQLVMICICENLGKTCTYPDNRYSKPVPPKYKEELQTTGASGATSKIGVT